MKIGLLVLSVGEGGQKGFYNTQETGLAKALDRLGHDIVVFKLVHKGQEKRIETIEGTTNAVIWYLPVKKIGNNGLPNVEQLDKSIDVLICFSDMQLAFPVIYRWARRNQISLYPYIGVLESHSSNRLKRLIMNVLPRRNLRLYRQCHCFAKTVFVQNQLLKNGIMQSSVATVGLDTELLETGYAQTDISKLKAEYGYDPASKVLLFIGRLIDEKQPLRMIEIFDQIRRKEPAYQLLMVGNGELKEQVRAAIIKCGLSDSVKLLERVPNKDIWKLYRMAYCFVNLNQQEIFGMALLEAMYYECKVIAWKAPGPEIIIEDGVSGYLVESNDAVIDRVFDEKDLSRQAHERIEREFTWANTARKIEQLIS